MFDPNSLTLNLETTSAPRHSVNLRSITSSACMLEILFQVSSQPWANCELIGELVKALQDLFDPRTTLCGPASNQTFDPVTYLRSKHVN